MNRKIRTLAWAAAILSVALLNIFDILPDWTTYVAVFTLPLLAILDRRNGTSECGMCALKR
jgi:hypothetical protein